MDREPREELWYSTRKSGAAEKYVSEVKDMYEDSETDGFKVGVGLGQRLTKFVLFSCHSRGKHKDLREDLWRLVRV